ncbi:hypothetical protein C3747_234g117c [Trypanosoma cruzi]|uniref:Uncharacterized protein n=2 Tax=Trypanosoma cruzi TaxID=5693 RepID=Q4D4T0_TRYCC|nr:hypothetical protein, conserved [Trypanosoma cruzi]EAN87534.1 hypothetical protein, conserved [Trypanosoma cruzi]KAF8301905.1 hypothetical protein TcYC6_0050330 [Trypanosoma cruzi]PWU98232.1 hypothetical protein C3747_234g117c [Trypanosoma cruzi]RNC61445.1 hypothetical protein TcCL_ESM00952 [Trypanosoma cruzi]|eukprot:XP_809385.1 hypothetical protein [Trypanosoma cruzi strain CL Brener]
MHFIPFVYQASFFSVVNAVGSVSAWYLTRRRMMLFTGAFNTTVAAVAVYAYPFDPTLSNAYVSIAATCAFTQFILHGLRTKALMASTPLVGVYYIWCLSLLVYGVQRGRWAYILRDD